MKNVQIEMPAALADMFLKLCDETLVNALANAGSNDFLLPDTPDNRETIELIEKEAFEDDADVSVHQGQLLTQDSHVLNAVIKRFREPLE